MRLTRSRGNSPELRWLKPFWFWRIVGFLSIKSLLGERISNLNYYERYRNKSGTIFLVDKDDYSVAIFKEREVIEGN